MAKEAKKTSADILAELEKQYGKGTAQDTSLLNDPIKAISTGSIALDHATGIGGVPITRITEITAGESVGKTTLATHILKEAQLADPRKVLILDVEHTFFFPYAIKIGLDPERVTFVQPEHGEMAFDYAKKLLATGDYSACVLDSVAAAIPKEQHEGETGQSRMARLAALMSLELPKAVPIIHKNDVAFIFLNQYRNNIGGYGNPQKPAGGDSLKYYASMMIDMYKTVEKDAGRNKVRAKISKNKCAPPHEEAEFYIDWGIGINRTNEVLDYAVEYELIKKGGSWFTFEGEHKVQGEIEAIKFLNDNPEMLASYTRTIMEKLKA